MRYVEVKFPMFGEDGLLSVPVQEDWVGTSMANLAISKSIKGIGRASPDFQNSIVETVEMEVVIEEERKDVLVPYLRIVLGIEDEPKFDQEQVNMFIDAEKRRRKPPVT